jgi:hypothetical protein
MPIGGIMLPGIALVSESAMFDPAQAVKRWADPSKAALAPADPASYMIFDSRSGTEVPLKITNGVAATANVPATYPRYAPNPPTTPATLTAARSGATPLVMAVAANSLSTMEQASALAAEMGPALNLQFSLTIWAQPGWVFNANNETREQFMLMAPGIVAANVGNMLALKNANGVGSPGSWSLNANGQILWNAVTVPQPTASTPPDMPFPVRALLPGESFRTGGLPGIWEVVSSNTFDPGAPATAGQVGQLQTDLNLIKQFLGING